MRFIAQSNTLPVYHAMTQQQVHKIWAKLYYRMKCSYCTVYWHTFLAPRLWGLPCTSYYLLALAKLCSSINYIFRSSGICTEDIPSGSWSTALRTYLPSGKWVTRPVLMIRACASYSLARQPFHFWFGGKGTSGHFRPKPEVERLAHETTLAILQCRHNGKASN